MISFPVCVLCKVKPTIILAQPIGACSLLGIVNSTWGALCPWEFAEQGVRNMDEEGQRLKRILESYRTVAVVGMSKDPNKPARKVPKFLMSKGYRIIPVNPTADEILGRKSYPTLKDVPEPVEIVDIFRPSPDVPEIVRQAIERGDVKVIWMQEGISNEEAAAVARAHGMEVVQDYCIYKAYKRFIMEEEPEEL